MATTPNARSASQVAGGQALVWNIDMPGWLVSVHGDEDKVATALRRAADKYLAKPVDFPRPRRARGAVNDDTVQRSI